MSPNPWLRAQTSDIFTLNVRHGRLDIVDFYADVMNATSLVFIKKTLYGRLLPKRMQQFQLRVGELYKDRGHSVLGQVLVGFTLKLNSPDWRCLYLRLANHSPKHVPVEEGGSLQVRHSDGHMIESTETPDTGWGGSRRGQGSN